MALKEMMRAYGSGTYHIVARMLGEWPEHERFLVQRFDNPADGHADVCEQIAERILRIVGDREAAAVANYRWTCQMFLKEEYMFRLTGRYRFGSFAEARTAVYDNESFMSRYADGLLLSQLLWANHAAAIESYWRTFLPRLDGGASLLEVGPGHGLLLAMAAERLPGAVTGWDVSQSSLALTQRALNAMGIAAARLELVDVLEAPTSGQFDAVVASELLEHLERPAEALRRLRQVTRPGGRLFLNIPVNSPAPDHIYLWRTPEEVFSFVADSGLEMIDAYVFPMTGKTMAQARAEALTLSCVVLCARPDGRAGDR
jgi:2-polyprenyl-3-methyl-5-hydroxy-6-metoxy-1,4-benzoquinol methylase